MQRNITPSNSSDIQAEIRKKLRQRYRQKYRSSGSNKNSSSQHFLEQQSFQFPLRNIPKNLPK
jgi:uncharacterized protein (DUF2267 family)